MTEFSKLKPVVIAVSLLSTLGVASSAMASHHHGVSSKVVKMNAVLDQNQGGVVEGSRNRPDWADRINVSGLINVDAIAQNRTPALSYVDNDSLVGSEPTPRLDAFARGEGANDIGLADANLFVDAHVNHWVNTHVALQFRDNDSLQAVRQFRKGNHFNPKDLASLNSAGRVEDLTFFQEDVRPHLEQDGLRVDEAFITLGNLEHHPFYLKAGRFYVPFGDYQRYSTTNSLTQLLSQTSETALQVGKVTGTGLSGAAYVFRGASKSNEHRVSDRTDSYVDGYMHIHNWGVQVAYAQDHGACMYDVGVGYLHNMADVDFIRAGLGDANEDNASFKFVEATPAVSVHADVRMKEYDAGFRWVAALEEFDPVDVPFKAKGSEPWAVTFDLGYSFEMMNRHSRLGLTYQKSDEAKNMGPLWMGLPLQRYGADLQVNVMNRTDLVFSLIKDRDYSREDGGTGKRVIAGTARLSVAFA